MNKTYVLRMYSYAWIKMAAKIQYHIEHLTSEAEGRGGGYGRRESLQERWVESQCRNDQSTTAKKIFNLQY